MDSVAGVAGRGEALVAHLDAKAPLPPTEKGELLAALKDAAAKAREAQRRPVSWTAPVPLSLDPEPGP